MKLLIIGHNRSGTTLIANILMKLFKYKKVDINKLICKINNHFKDDDFVGFPSLSKATISSLKKDNDIISFTTKFNCIFDLGKLPNNCIFRVNQVDSEDISLLAYFDAVIHIKRSRAELLCSNLLDLPPAFELFNLVDLKMRENIALKCLKDIKWINKINRQLDNDNQIFEKVKNYSNRFHCMSFGDLINNPKNTLVHLINELKLNISLKNIDEVLLTTLNKPLSKWRTHLNDSSIDLKNKIIFGLNNYENEKSTQDKYIRINKILVVYKKILYNSEFSISLEECQIKNNQLAIKSFFDENKKFNLTLEKFLK